MFPGRLPQLPSLTTDFASQFSSPLFVEIGGGSGGSGGGLGGGFPSVGGINIGVPPMGGGNPASGGGSGKTVSVGLPGSVGSGASMLSSLLGLPAINWGRIAAFLLGLILIAGGIYLIKPVQETVNRAAKAAIV